VLSTYGAARLLARADVVEACLRRLRQAAERHAFRVLAYCFMPTHLHLLILGKEKSRLLPFVKYFKQMSSFDCRGEKPQLWQRSFYDRVLRVEEDLEVTACHIWGNPVRAGIVDDWEKYPFSGPFGADLKVRPYED
jgi:putative transposase